MPGTPRKKIQPPKRKPNPMHRADYERFRGLLLQWRTDAQLTQRDVAKRLGKSLAWVNRCEKGGRRVDVLEFLDWVKACGVEPSYAVRALNSPKSR